MVYGHGDDAYKYDVDIKANFSSNVSYKGINTKLIDHLKNQFSKIASYPSPNADELTKSIAKHHNINTENVLVTNGATEAFYTIANSFSKQSVAIGIPTFMEYESACKSHNISPSYFPRENAVSGSYTNDLVFICNPNNPNGFSNTVSEIETLLKNNPKTTFVIDEAYIDFTLDISTCTPLLQNYNNLIIVKSLTKLFAIPGLRLGYILTSATIIEKLLLHKMPWSVNTLAIEAGLYIFKQFKQLQPNIETFVTENKQLQQEVNAINGFEVIPSNTNYFLVKLSEPKSSELKDYLVHNHQLLIRDAANFNGLNKHYIRIASQSTNKNNLLITALKEWTQKQ